MSIFQGRQKAEVKSYGLRFLHTVVLCFLCTLDNVPIAEGPSVSHKAALQNKTAICHCFQNALKRSTMLPLSDEIQSAHVGGQESETKRKYLQCIFERIASSLASFLQMALKKAQRKPMIYLKGPGVFCPVA